MTANARMIRMMELTQNCIDQNCMFTSRELDQIVADAMSLVTPQIFLIIEQLAKQAKAALSIYE